MKKGWNKMKLSDFLSVESNNQIRIQPDIQYTIAGVQNGGKGVLNKRQVIGSELTMPVYKVVKKDQLLWCKVDTRNGAFGITGNEHDGSVVSTNMHLANIDAEIMAVDYFMLLLQHKPFYAKIEAISEGSTNRRYASKDQIFNLEIPLPPLSEQRHIAARLQALKGKIEELRRLREEQEREMKKFRNGVYFNNEKTFGGLPLGEMLVKSEKRITPIMGTMYRQVGVKWWGEGAYERDAIDGGQTAYQSFCPLELNDFIFNKIWVRHGALAVVKENTVGCFAPSEFPVYKCRLNKINPKWLDFVVTSPIFWEKCADLSKGTSGKNRIRPELLLGIQIPVPPMQEQERLVEILDKMDALKAAQSGQLLELEGLFPGVLEKAFQGEQICQT